jgi:hypothetical protein
MMWLLTFPILSILLFAAHLLFWGKTLWILYPLALIAVLFIPRRFIARLLQLSLLCFAAEWGYSAYALFMRRILHGQPWGTAVAILAAVTLLTALSAFVFQTKRLRQHYGMN